MNTQTLEKLIEDFKVWGHTEEGLLIYRYKDDDGILPRELIVYDKDRNIVPAMYKRVRVND